MASNLRIAWVDIPGATCTASPTGATGYESSNVVAGQRASYYRLATAGTTSIWDFDYATTTNPNLLVLSGLKNVVASDSAAVAWEVKASAAADYSSPATQSGTIAAANLVGSGAEDYASTLTYASAYRYWRFTLTTTATVNHELGKLYICTAMDFDHDPIRGRSIERTSEGNYRMPAYKFELEWNGVTDAKINSFVTNCAQYATTRPVFLTSSSYHYVLNDTRVMHAQIVDHEVIPRTGNNNTLRVQFKELV